MKVEAKVDIFPLKKVFTISRGSRTVAEVVTVKLTKNNIFGFGECVPYKRYNETVDSVLKQINEFGPIANRVELNNLLPPGAARNALDCAFWDLEAKSNNTSVKNLLSIKTLPLITSYTLSIDTPKIMGEEAKKNAHLPILKIKLGGGEEDLDRIKSIRLAAPNSKIIVDANEGWSLNEYKKLIPHFVELDIKMIEQPFPAENDCDLKKVDRPIPICADESCHDSNSLDQCLGKYDVINIKLDKTGGLTEAIRLKNKAKQLGFEVMVGCMIGSSLSMAPALFVAQDAKWVDLDGPLLLSKDREYPLHIDGSSIHPPLKELWG